MIDPTVAPVAPKVVAVTLAARMRMMALTLWHREHWWAEFWSGVSSALWGKLDYFSANNITSIHRYDVFAHIAPHVVTDLIVFSAGIVQLAMLFAHNRLGRLGAAATLLFFYCVFALSLIVADGWNQSPTYALVIGFLGINAFALARLCREDK